MPYKDYDKQKSVTRKNMTALRIKRHKEAKIIGVSFNFYNKLTEPARQKLLQDAKEFNKKVN